MVISSQQLVAHEVYNGRLCAFSRGSKAALNAKNGVISRKAAKAQSGVKAHMPVDLLTPLISAAVLILAPIVAAVRGGLRSWVVVDLAKFILLWLYFLEEPNLHLWAERSMNIWFWVFLGWLSFVPSLAAVIWLLYTRRMAEVEVVLPVDAERPAPSAATKKIYEILSRSYDTDQPDLAERHNEHQP